MIDVKTAPYAGLVLRVSLGIMFIAHGLLKLLVFTPAGTAGFFEQLGLPGILAYLTIVAELGGGVLLIAGILTRWVSLALIAPPLGSIVFLHWSKGWLFTNEGGGWEFPAFWVAALVVQALIGNGAYAVQLPASWHRALRTA
jgi:putative oxidoreductase